MIFKCLTTKGKAVLLFLGMMALFGAGKLYQVRHYEDYCTSRGFTENYQVMLGYVYCEDKNGAFKRVRGVQQ